MYIHTYMYLCIHTNVKKCISNILCSWEYFLLVCDILVDFIVSFDELKILLSFGVQCGRDGASYIFHAMVLMSSNKD